MRERRHGLAGRPRAASNARCCLQRESPGRPCAPGCEPAVTAMASLRNETIWNDSPSGFSSQSSFGHPPYLYWINPRPLSRLSSGTLMSSPLFTLRMK